jgi:hypothetical protein
MKRTIKIVGLPVIGLLIVMTGFVYDVLFAGIPYQDPTPELQAHYDFHSSVAGLMYKTGGIALLLGLLAIPGNPLYSEEDKKRQMPTISCRRRPKGRT